MNLPMAESLAMPVAKGVCKVTVSLYKGLQGYDCKKLARNANNLLPMVGEICESSSESPPNLSLQDFKDYRENLVNFIQLEEAHKKTSNPWRKWWINKEAKMLGKRIKEFIQNDLQIVLAHAQHHLSTQMDDLRTLQKGIDAKLDIVSDGVETLMISQAQTSAQLDAVCKVVVPKFYSPPPDTPTKFLGFSEHIANLKKILLEEEVNLVGITAMGGAGKSTLAAAICKRKEIRDNFKVIYLEVTESPDLLTILKTMWANIRGEKSPEFLNVGNARNSLQLEIKSTKQSILVVLDDVWSTDHLDKLLFQEKQYKTLVTTRDRKVIRVGPYTKICELPLLQQTDALSLFCHYAFDQTSVPIDRGNLPVEEVQQICNGLPLALKVIGSSLYGKSDSDWEQAKEGLLAEGPFSAGDNQSLVNILKTSIDVLSGDERECFLDLGAFPQKRAIPVKALLDIWVYVRELSSEQAKMRLLKFADRHLLELKKETGTSEVTNNMDGYSVFQHGIMRDVALNLANQDNSRRLYMHKMENHLPAKWKDISSKAHIVSIHTGAMEDSDWPKMEFPKAKALVLYFTASEYCIPMFLNTMKKLQVLIIHNCDGAKRSELSGVSVFQELSQLKTLHLERLIFPEKCNHLKSLEKINMSLCGGLDRDLKFSFSELLEFNVSYCIDLEELPAGLCSSVRLKKLSVTHCHRLAKLSDQMDRFESLEKIRLFESPSLKTLPCSITSLKHLKYFDISSCISLKVNRREHSELKETLQKIARMPSLKRVICDRTHEQLFEKIHGTEIKVDVVDEAEPSLSFLDG